jgi:lipopolysaccharide export system ATP-binding protein
MTIETSNASSSGTAADSPSTGGDIAALLVATGLRVTIGGREVVRGVSIHARAGEVVGLLGPSGSGKSSFFRAAAGEGPGTWETLTLNGIQLDRLPTWARARAGLGYMPQEPSVLWDQTALANLRTFARVLGKPDGAISALERVGLAEVAQTKAGKLSGGERRKLELARILLSDSQILLCDEPFAGVDPKAATALGLLLRAYADAGHAVILADHHIQEALAICDRALLLVDGAAVVEAKAAEFANHVTVQQRYLAPSSADHKT